MDRDTLFGPKRVKARAIDWDQIRADFHQGARRQSRNQDAVYMAAADQTPDPNNPLAMQQPSIHGLVAVWCRSFDSVMCSKGDELWAQSGRMNFARMRCGSH